MTKASLLTISAWRHTPRVRSQLITLFAVVAFVSAACAEPRDVREVPAPQTSDLFTRVDTGQVELTFEPGFGYLRSILKAVGISEASQLLVFSKTSCQREHISPRTPRALYFNDNAYVAWVPNTDFLEISTADPKAGAIFYTLEQKPSSKPKLVRRDQCLECHTSRQTLNVPGYVVRSYPTAADGVVGIADGWSMVDHSTPWSQRWGGWYITPANSLPHVNGIPGANSDAAPNASAPGLLRGPQDPGAVADLSRYLRATSDLIASLVFQHQLHMENLITRVGLDARAPGADPAGWKPSADALARYLLFTDEIPLPAPVQLPSPYVTWFESTGPHDRQGRCLRQFDLQTRLFKYPCSYMIYSSGFDALPRPVQLHIYRQLWSALTSEERHVPGHDLSSPVKRAVLEILLETKTDLPISWRL